MKTLIIIPAYNEQNSILDVVKDINATYKDVDYIVINDSSTDDTKKLLKENRIKYLDSSINLGIGGAVQTGYLYAEKNGYDIAVQVDADGQHDIKYIQSLIEPIEKKEADICIGSRYIEKKGFQSTKMRRFGILILSGLIFLCTGKRIKDVTSGFRAVNQKFIKIYSTDYPQDYPEPEALITAVMNRGTIKEIPVLMKERETGKSSINLWKSIYYMIKVTLAIIVCRISYGIRRGKNASK